MNRGGPDSNSAGPHPVSIANKLDPRVASDGDRETTAIPGTSTTGSDYSSFTTGQSGTTDNYGTTDDYGNSPQSTSEGPRSSNIAGRFAPDVSSDRDGSSSYGTTAGYSNNQQSTSEGPNSSNIAGRFAPNVGSDRDGSRTMGSNTAVDTSSSSRMTGSDSTSTRVTGQDDTSTGPTGGMAQGANATGGRPRPEHETDKTGVTSMHSNDPKFSDQRQSEAGSSSVDTRGQSKGPTGGFGAVEPSVSADPSSGQKPMQKEQGADRPNEEPSGEQADAVRAKKEATENVQAGNDTGAGSKETGGKETKKDPNDHSGEPLGAVDHSGSSEKKPAGQEGGDPHGEDKSNKGTGEKWVKTTGMAADGGDFDATKPGAGKEAERKSQTQPYEMTWGSKVADENARSSRRKGHPP